MAVSNCTRTCKHCGKIFQRTHKGQPTKYCSISCRDKVKRKRFHEWKLSNPLYAKNYERQRTPRRTKGICAQCTKHIDRAKQGQERKGRPIYCSITCARIGTARIIREVSCIRAIAHKAGPLISKHKARINKEAIALHRIGNYKPGLRPTVRPCIGCGVKTLGTKNYKRQCRRCKEQALSDWKRSDSGRAAKRRYNSKRRAAEKGVAAENIDPISVFDRDGWKCQLCQRSTPRRLRGTYQDNAPELDHIVPLAVGGQHTWGNVHCACRKCNIEKSDKPLGQMGFNIAV